MAVKLAYLCSTESWGGLEMNHLRNAIWMQSRGHEVVVVCIKDSPLDKQARDAKLSTIYLSKHRKYYAFKSALRLKKLITENQISHLIIRSTRDISIVASIKWMLGSKIHTSYFMEMQLGVKKDNLLHTIRFKGIDVWSCPLNWLEDQVRTMTNFKNKLIVIPSGLDLSQFANLSSSQAARKELRLPQNQLLLGLIGRFDVQKGQLLLLEAMKICSNKEFGVLFLGEPTMHEGNVYFEDMKNLISKYKLENRVYIRPFRKDIATFYSAIDWFIMASKAETFGMVTIEALACGTPVLGSNAGGTPEILSNKAGLLFKSLDAIDLALQIDRIVEENVTFREEILKDIARNYDHIHVCQLVEEHLDLFSSNQIKN